ncbi:MAG: 1-acyl-sn-glycerol-3-phosphate acyltransferase [Bacteroidota bacterium]
MTPVREAATVIHLPPEAPLPALPPSLPRRPYRLIRPLARVLFRVLGWRLDGGFPNEPRQVLIGWPHTSNWDGLIGLLGAAACGIDARIYAKAALFRGPLAWVLRGFGCIPVERDRPGGRVGVAVDRFEAAQASGESFVLALSPEGTRARGDGWRLGFHRIAVQAQVPVAVLSFDYERKRLCVHGALHLSGDEPTDLGAIMDLLSDARGKIPALATPPTD